MPTVSVDAISFYQRLRKVCKLPEAFDLETFTKALDELCFEFGLEYDGVEQPEGESSRIKLKIEVGANRYDLLCLSGIADALIRYKSPSICPMPQYRYSIAKPTLTMTVEQSVLKIRPYVVAAVFRNATFDELSFQAFIDLQDKLHQNLGRKRTLVSIGTHDMSKLKGPFYYKALPKKGGFKFEPLKNAGTVVDGEGMFKLLADGYLKPYLPIIEGFDLTPIVCEQGDKVVSVPPIINADRCKMSVDTKDVFVEITATDARKAHIFLDVVTCFMGEIVKDKFTVEPVKIVYGKGHPGVPIHSKNEQTVTDYREEEIVPTLKTRTFYCATEYIRRIIGVQTLEAEHICAKLLPRMGLKGTVVDNGIGIQVECPISRRDILHACDIVEDIAIAFGYDNILPQSHYAVSLQPIANIGERARRILSVAGWRECLTFGLVAAKDVYQDLRRKEPASIEGETEWYCRNGQVVRVAEPKAREFEVIRCTLIPGVLKTLASNQAAEMPIKLFEIGDTVMKAVSADNKAVQRRHVAALLADAHKSGLEETHGLLDTLLRTLNLTAEYSLTDDCSRVGWIYYLKEVDDGAFLKGRTVSVEVYRAEEGRDTSKSIGLMGVVHPEVLQSYNIPVPCSLFEISLEPFRDILSPTDQTMP